MKRTGLLTLFLALSLAASAAFNTVTLTGFNRDIISNGAVSAMSSISPSMTAGFDSGGYALVAQDYNYAGYTPSYYLPTGGLLNSSLTTSLTFQLASYSANNALRLVNTGDTGRLTFTTPQIAGTLYVLGLSASGDTYADITVHFTDGTSQLFAAVYLPDWYSSGGTINGIGRVSTTDNHTEGLSSTPALFEQALNIDPANYTKLISALTVQKSSGLGITAVMAVSASSICSGTPTAGTASASVTSGCSAFTTDLSLPGATAATGITYQWQSSPDGTTWSNIAAATTATYTATVAANTYFRAYLLCSISGLADTSGSVEVLETAPAPVSATLPFSESFESWVPACYSFDRPGVSWTENPTTGNTSWRRDDQGDDATWHNPTAYMYSPAGTVGAHSARFHSGWAYPAGSTGDMDLHINLSPAGVKRISFDYNNLDGSDFITVYLSEDGGATFTSLGVYNTTSAWESETLTTTSVAANAVIRLEGTSDYGSTDIGVDNLSVVALTPCSGTPVAGTISASQQTGCSEFTANLTLPTSSLSGLAYQWQSSADSATWADVPGATNDAYAADVTTNVYYRVYVTCTASTLTDTSAGILLQIVVPVATNATLPFFEGFESWTGTCYSFDRPGMSWLQTPVTGNASWRRDDQGADAAWSYPTEYMYSPASTEGAHSARFHSGWAYPAGSEGDLDLHIDLSAAGTKIIKFDYINTDGDDNMNVLLSEDGGTTFTPLGAYTVTPSGWASEILSTSSVAANAVIRFAAFSDYEASDIGIDSLSIYVAPPCAGAPTAGPFSASQAIGCSAYTATLSVDAPIFLSGISYQWQSSTTGTGYTNVPGATNSTYAAAVSGDIYYRFYVVCGVSGLADTSAAMHLIEEPVVPVTATLPYFQSFESWIGGCAAFDRPDASSTTSPSTGNNSWRRDDQGSDAAWDNPLSGSYFPVGTDGAHSARFHSYGAFGGSEGDLDIHLDLSPAGLKLIKFDYNNNDGSDYVMVQLSEDGGITFTTLGTYYTYADWTSLTVSTTSVAPGAILRFAAISDFGGTDIGIDSLSVSVAPSCGGTPVAGTFTATQTSGCTDYSTDLAVTTPVYLTGITYQWQSSVTGSGFTNVAGATDGTYTASITGNVYYRFYVTCAGSGLSDTSAAQLLIDGPEVATTAVLPYFQGSENWMSGCAGFDRPDSSWLLDPTTGDASWRREDQGSYANWTDSTSGEYFPSSTEGSHSARFHTYGAAAGDVGIMDLHINLSSVGTKNISFDYLNTGDMDSLYIYLSEDGGSTFTMLAGYGTTSGWEPEALTTTSVASNAVIRFSAISDYGFTDIGVDSLYISAPPCPMATGLTATSITRTSAVLGWSSVAGASGYEYVVDNSAGTPTGASVSTTATSVTDTSLSCGLAYYLHVRTDCSADSSAWGTLAFSTDSCAGVYTANIVNADFDIIGYPNPATNILTVEIKGVIADNPVIQLTDVTGKVLLTTIPANNKVVISLADLAAGMYFINYSDNLNKRTLKVNKL